MYIVSTFTRRGPEVASGNEVDEFKREHHGFDDHDFDWELHDRKHDYIDDEFEYGHCDKPDTNPVPLPAAAWLFMSGLAGLVRMGHRRKK